MSSRLDCCVNVDSPEICCVWVHWPTILRLWNRRVKSLVKMLGSSWRVENQNFYIKGNFPTFAKFTQISRKRKYKLAKISLTLFSPTVMKFSLKQAKLDGLACLLYCTSFSNWFLSARVINRRVPSTIQWLNQPIKFIQSFNFFYWLPYVKMTHVYNICP